MWGFRRFEEQTATRDYVGIIKRFYVRIAIEDDIGSPALIMY